MSSPLPRSFADRRRALAAYRSQPIFALCLACLAATLPSGAASGAEPTRFARWRELRRERGAPEEIVAARLDADVHASTRDGWPDLRVFDQTDGETPYELERVADRGETRTFGSTRAIVRSLRETDESLELVVALDPDAPAADGVRFVTPLRDYERTVRVFGAGEGGAWRPLGDEALVYDYRRFLDLSQTDVPLPANTYREFKITVTRAVDDAESTIRHLERTLRGGREEQRVERTTIERRPFRIDRLEFLHARLAPTVGRAAEVEYLPAGWRVERDEAARRTIVHVDSRREPLVTLALRTKDRNFQRTAAVEVRDEQTPRRWVEIGRATLVQIDYRRVRREQLEIRFPEHRADAYRIVIDDHDNPPLEIADVVARGHAYQAVFLARPDRTYRMFYGSETVDAPRYDAAAVLAAARREGEFGALPLGPEQANRDFGGDQGAGLRRLLGSWLFLGLAITVAVAVLAWSLVRANRQLQFGRA